MTNTNTNTTPAAPAATVEELQRQYDATAAKLAQIAKQLERAQWLREFEQGPGIAAP